MAYTPSTPLQQVEALYIGYFGRAGEPGGVQYWVDQIQAGRTFAQVAAAFSVQQEAKSQHPFLANPDLVNPGDFVESLYQQIYGRASDATGKAYWVAQIQAANGNPFNIGLLVAQFISGAQGDDITVITNKVAAAEYFTGKLASAGNSGVDAQGQVTPQVDAAATSIIGGVTKDPASVTAANAKTDTFVGANGNPGISLVLTTSADNLQGTADNDTFSGFVNTTAASIDSTLTAADTINGQGGIDRLDVVFSGTGSGSLVPAAITNVERFFIRDVSTGGASSYDFGTVNGEQAVWSDRSSAAVTLTNLGANTTVGALGNGGAKIGDIAAAYAAAPTNVNVAVNSVGKTGAGNAQVINFTSANGENATITSAGNSASFLALDLGTGSNVKNLTINAGSNLTVTLDDTDTVATGAALTVSGAATNVNLGANGVFKTVNAAGLTSGGVTMSSDAVLTSFTGGGGKDVLTLVGSTASATINLGAGNDILLGAVANAPVSTVAIDGGAGTDSVAAALVNAGNGAKFLNFEQLDIAGFAGTLDAALLTGSTITGLSQSANGAGGTINNLAAASAGITVYAGGGGSQTVNVVGATAGANDTFTVKFAGEAQATAPVAANVIASTLTLPGIENVVIESGGGANTWNQIVLANTAGSFNSVKNITVTGAQNLNLGVPAQTTAVGANTTDLLSSIDGSAATGKLNIQVGIDGTFDLNPALTVKGGSAADILNVVAVTAPEAGNNITLTGNGGNDEFILEDLVVTNTAAISYGTISDLTKGDIIDGSNGAIAFASAKFDVGAAASLEAAAGLALAGVAGEARWFQYGADTYVVYDNNAGAIAANDVVVKLTGLLDLSGSSIVAGDLTYA